MLSIRNAREADIELIRQMTYDIWPKAYGHILTKAQLDYMLANMYAPPELKHQMASGQQYILCFDDELPIGFASYTRINEDTYKLNKLYVLMEIHKKGIGKQLLNRVIKSIKEQGANALILNVNRYNTNAQAFYKKQGFTTVCEEDIDIGDGYFMNDYVLRLEL